VVGGQLQALVAPCKLLQLSAQEKTHPVTVMSSCALGQEKIIGSTDVSWWPGAESTRAEDAQLYFKTAFTFLLREGKTSSSNQGFFFSQILFLGLGCGKGMALGQ